MANRAAKRKIKQQSQRRRKATNPDILKHVAALTKNEQYSELIEYLNHHQNDLDDIAKYHELMGLTLFRSDRLVESVNHLKLSIQHHANSARYSYLANSYHVLGNFDKAIEWHQKAIRLDPKNASLYHNFAFTLEDMQMYEEAIQSLEIGRQLDPSQTIFLYQLGRYNLAIGELEKGSQLIDAGLGCNRRTVPAGIKGSYWRGQDIQGKRIVVWQEEGVGDEVRNACMYKDLLDRGAELVIECRARLASVFKRSFPGAIIMPQDEPPSPYLREPFDYHCGQNTLLQYLRPSLSHFPASGGFIKPDPDLVDKWRKRLASFPNQPVVGISWTSGLISRQRAQTLWPVQVLRDILRTPGVSFVSLQYSATKEQVEELNNDLDTNIHFLEDIDLRNDLENSFALSSCLDYVVSAPTSTLILAGAVGTPGLCLYNARHSTMLGTDHFPYIPSIEVVRRKHGQSWESKVPELNRRFQDWLAGFRANHAQELAARGQIAEALAQA